MKIKFDSRIKKGNKTGTGFFYIPRDESSSFRVGTRIEVKLPERVHFFAKIVKYGARTGVYIPAYLMRKNRLLNRDTRIQIEEIDGFYSKIYPDGRIYIPQDVIKDQNFKQNDVVLIKGIKDNKVVKESYSKIHVTIRKERKRLEYTCVFDKKFYGKNLIFKIENKTPKDWKPRFNINVINTPLEKMHYGFIDRNSSVAFYGIKVPVIINTKLRYSDIAFYLGAYFSDGTKIGNSWAICASTFKQAKYYWEIHNLLVKDSKPEFTISYTNIYNIDYDEVIERLTNEWADKTGIKIQKFRIRRTTGTIITKWNKHGTLIIREHRQILLDFYNSLLKSLIREILSKKNKKLALDFICGVLEGDGCAPATKFGHVMISTNKNEIHILKDILKVARIKFRASKDTENKCFLIIGSLEILRNFHLLKDKIFELYPKRRKNFFERFKTVGAVKFLGGNHRSANWVKAWLCNNGFADRNYKITKKGLKTNYYIQNYIITR